MIADCEARLLKAIRGLKYGVLYPAEMVVKRQVEFIPTPAERELLDNCAEYGTPLEIKVANGCPVYAVFEIATPAGRAHKRIEL